MSVVRRNTLANYAGQAWAAVMSIAFVPIYIRYLGIEAYGIIGLFVTLQSLFTILDMGLSAALNRELARRSNTAAGADDTRDLVRTMEWIYWPTGVLIALLVWAASGYLAEHWLRPVSLSVEQAAVALLLLGLSIAVQWPISFYTGGLAGLQRQVLLNALLAAFSTVRAGGAVLVLLLITPTLEAFLWWQMGVSAAQSLAYAVITWGALPRGSRSPRFLPSGLKQIGGFAIAVTGITFVSFLLTQSDRVILSKILPLDAFGIYAFAASLAFALGRLVQPIFTAVYPRYSQLVAAGDVNALAGFYHRTNQVMSAAVLPVAAVLATYAQDIVWLWTGDMALSSASAPIVALLVSGSALNGLMNLPFALQLAYGWTRLSLWINVVSVVMVVPAVWILGQEYGGVGAASVWLALNLGYLVIGIPLMHRRLLPGEMSRWYSEDIAPSLAACTVMVLAWRTAVPEMPNGVPGWILLLVVMTTTLAVSLFASAFPRSIMNAWWNKLRGSVND